MRRKSDIRPEPEAKLLPRLSLAFFNRPRLTALLWIAITIFGIVSYTSLLRREGFPSVTIPVVIVSGTYAINDAAAVDRTLAAPVAEIALRQSGVKAVSSQSGPNFFSATLQYEEKVDAADAKKSLQAALDVSDRLPDDARLSLGAPYFGVTGAAVEQVDATISVFSDDPGTSLQELVGYAGQVATYLNANKPAQVKSFTVAEPFRQVVNPQTGKPATVQRTFDRFGEHTDAGSTFRQSVIINVASVADTDVIKLDDQLRASIDKYKQTDGGKGVGLAVSASYAPSIKESISELQRVLLEGLIAVLVVGSVIIAIRASVITVISMVTVIAATIAIVYAVGYTLNVITLFALILGLALIVDDTIIMVEALDSARRTTRDRQKAVKEATQKISRAMTAATLTAALSFTPLLFVGGVLGTFIRAIPVTIISALLISLVVALVFIPLFARWLVLGRGTYKLRERPQQVVEGSMRKLEKRIAAAIVRPMLWARTSRTREFAVGLAAVLVGLSFIGTGVLVFRGVAFNIFPPSKDTNQLAVDLTFPAGTTVPEAEAIAERADKLTSEILGDNLEQASYYGMANERSARLTIQLKPYGEREPTAPQLSAELERRFKSFGEARAAASPIDAGPPPSNFKVDITASDRKEAERLAADMAEYLESRELVRPNGTKALISEASVSNTSVFQRSGTRPVISVEASFQDTDTTTLTTLAKAAVAERYTDQTLASYGLKASDVTVDLGQESENQDSFKALAIAFPIVLLAIYLLLILEFRSFLQPLLIFMALPFSFFGIALGLYYTDNPFSFFSMLGFFALIGLSIKNTILLTDYANQARRSGARAVDAVAGALSERFRPLVATSLTAVVSLIPLALTSPFWESLAVTLIFGLLSSTFLVITVFPYYYLGAEYFRMLVSRRRR